MSAEEICMQQGESAQERGCMCSKRWGRKNQIESMLRPCHPVPWMELQGLMFVLMGFCLSVTWSLIACAVSPFWNGMFIRCHWKYVTSFLTGFLWISEETLLCSLLNNGETIKNVANLEGRQSAVCTMRCPWTLGGQVLNAMVDAGVSFLNLCFECLVPCS